MNKIPNRQVMCDVLKEAASHDRDVVVLCSDSRGSASLTSFADTYPEQFVEVGIAEQNLVSIAAGLAACGKKAYAASPASFISTRSYEQCKVDCAYSNTNVKLVGISGGISYGALGMTHHSAQDIAAMSAIPGMRVYLPSDRHQTRKLFEHLLQDTQTAYIRLGRNPVEDVYSEDHVPFEMNRAVQVHPGEDVLIVACGELVRRSPGHVLRKAPGPGKPDPLRPGQGLRHHRGRARALRRTRVHGGPGHFPQLSPARHEPDAAGCPGHHRNLA